MDPLDGWSSGVCLEPFLSHEGTPIGFQNVPSNVDADRGAVTTAHLFDAHNDLRTECPHVYHMDILYNSVDVRQEEVLARVCEVIPLHGHTRELVVSGSSAGVRGVGSSMTWWSRFAVSARRSVMSDRN
jgi:hypothetical protein